MKVSDLDIVYFVKESSDNEELKYSLRSVEKNFPHARVVFVGGCPKGLEPDLFIPVPQTSKIKWENTNKSLKTACSSKEISDNFVYFNDDFFIMSMVEELPVYYNSTLDNRIIELSGYVHSDYRVMLNNCKRMLQNRYLPTYNYAIHVPMIIDKKKMLECMKFFPNGLMWRSLYGNFVNPSTKECTNIKDVKIFSTFQRPTGNEIFLSTTDNSFKSGEVGKHIRKRFKEKSRFEK